MDMLESTITPQGRHMLATWQTAANGANGYRQMMLEELSELFKVPTKEEETRRRGSYQPSLFELLEPAPQISHDETPAAEASQEPAAAQAAEEPQAIEPSQQEAQAAAEPEEHSSQEAEPASQPAPLAEAAAAEAPTTAGANQEAGEQATPASPEPEQPRNQQPAALAAEVCRDPEQIKQGDIILVYSMALYVVKVNRVSFSCTDLQEPQPWKHKIQKREFEKRLFTAAEWRQATQAERNQITPGKHPINNAPTWTWFDARLLGKLCRVRVLQCGTYTAHLDIWPYPHPDGYIPALYTSYVSYAHLELIDAPQPPPEPEREETQATAEPTELAPQEETAPAEAEREGAEQTPATALEEAKPAEQAEEQEPDAPQQQETEEPQDQQEPAAVAPAEAEPQEAAAPEEPDAAPNKAATTVMHSYEPDTALHWLEFPSKPDAETRTRLKAEHWRFVGSAGQWRRAGLLTPLPELPGYRYEEAGEVDYAAERAEHYEQRAQAAEQRATTAHGTADRIASYIPFGQPILVGHHSERRHRRDLDKIDRNMRTAIEESRKAEHLHDRAEGGLALQAHKQSPGALARRLEELHKSLKLYQQNSPSAYAEEISRLTREIARVEALLAEAGGLAADHIDLQKGDLILIHGHIVEVIRVNRKTITGYLASPVHNLFSSASGYTKRTERDSGQHDRTRFSVRIFTAAEWATTNEGRTQAEAYAIAEMRLKEMRRSRHQAEAENHDTTTTP